MSDKKPPSSRKGQLKWGDDDEEDGEEESKSSASATPTHEDWPLSDVPHPGKNGKS